MSLLLKSALKFKRNGWWWWLVGVVNRVKESGQALSRQCTRREESIGMRGRAPMVGALVLLWFFVVPRGQQHRAAEHGRDAKVGEQHFIARIQHDRVDASCRNEKRRN